MAESYTTFIAQSVQTASASTLKITVAGTPYTITIAAQWYRHYLASSAGAGTSHTAPREAGDYLADQINASIAGCTVRMRSDGRWELTHSGGTWSILWDGTSSTDKIARDLYGFASNVASTAAGTYAVADYHGVGVIANVARTGDAGWQPKSTMESVETEAGIVVAQKHGYVRNARMFDLGFLPTNKTARTALGRVAPVALPDEDDGSRFQQPSTSCMGSMAGPWSAMEFLHTAPGVECGACFGTFADHISGASTRYDKIYVPNCMENDDVLALIQEGYSQQRHVRGVRALYNGSATRS